MKWDKEYFYKPQFEFASSNQHGMRFKRVGNKRCSIAIISCERTDVAGMLKLILLSNTLDIPVRYDFNGDQEAYIKVVGREALEENL